MGQIAVFHPSLTARGGGESVCMNVLEALQSDHDLTVVSVADPDFEALNAYHNTEVTGVSVDRVGRVGPTMSTAADLLSLADTSLWKLRSGVLKRFWDPSPYDLVISTYNEFSFRQPAIQYVHYPNAAGDRRPFVRWLYMRLWELLDESDTDVVRASRLLANSEWTAAVTSDHYGKRPDCIYPPVDVAAFDGRSWADREPGFVAVGRIEPTKNVLRLIEIVTRLREQGYETHLHVVGPLADPAYSQRVRTRAATHDCIHVEGSLSRSALVDLIGRHRYGIHGKENEHFGMAVAELVAGGTVPFVHDSGGQREIVDRKPVLTYDDVDDAVATIAAALDRSDGGRSLRSGLDASRFDRERFRSAIRDVVSEVLEE